MKETDLAKQLIKSFDGTGYDVYQEVDSPVGSTDIVLKHPSFIWAIEIKLSFNLTVIAQADANLKYYNYSSICVPSPGSGTKNWNFGIKLCRQLGIGVFTSYKYDFKERLKAKLQRKALTKKIILYEDKKDFANAGNNGGVRWTAFKETVQELEIYIKSNPGCKMRDALSHIKHHYASISSGQSSIVSLIKSGVIETISNDHGILNLK